MLDNFTWYYIERLVLSAYNRPRKWPVVLLYPIANLAVGDTLEEWK
jgi:hypothetical protein